MVFGQLRVDGLVVVTSQAQSKPSGFKGKT